MALSWSTFKLLPTKVHEEPYFGKLMLIASYFKLKLYPCLNEQDIAFEQARVFCDNLDQYAPRTHAGMAGEGVWQQILKEQRKADPSAVYAEYLAGQSKRPAPEESCAPHGKLTDYLRKCLCHDSFKTALDKVQRALFPAKARELMLGNFIEVIGGSAYLGLGCPEDARDQEQLLADLIKEGLVISSAPYGGGNSEILILQRRREEDNPELGEAVLRSCEALAEQYGVPFYANLKVNRIRFEQARMLCKVRL